MGVYCTLSVGKCHLITLPMSLLITLLMIGKGLSEQELIELHCPVLHTHDIAREMFPLCQGAVLEQLDHKLIKYNSQNVIRTYSFCCIHFLILHGHGDTRVGLN